MSRESERERIGKKQDKGEKGGPKARAGVGASKAGSSSRYKPLEPVLLAIENCTHYKYMLQTDS